MELLIRNVMRKGITHPAGIDEKQQCLKFGKQQKQMNTG